ncbi:uncharacterized protein [Macrobrachium rosenbergii]|uniref:uncharacterized protein n=1 Tax=Macrobrachium rosenbergii TaxID=79674 RepID=UPI0034D504C1
MCFKCLQTMNHTYGNCKEAPNCSKCGVDSHHTLLHKEHKPASTQRASASTRKKKNVSGGGNQTGASETESATTPNPEAEPAPAHVHATSCPDGRTMLKIVPALINGTHATYAFIDSGSAPTLVTKGLVEKLGLQGRSCNQKMITEAGTFTCRKVVSLDIGNIDGSESDHISEAFVTDRINVSTDHLMPTEWLGQWPHLREVELHTLPEEEQEVEVIIGLNTTLNRIILDQRHGKINKPSAYLTKLGWVTFGPTGGKNDVLPVYSIQPQDDVTELLQKNFCRDFWEKEALSKTEDSLEDKRFVELMTDSVKQEDGHYVASLPYRDDVHLPDNHDMARKRAQTLKRKLEADEAYRTSYTEQVEKYIMKGYAERVPDEARQRRDGRVWYMPHHAVKHPMKPKVRVVFDLKARFGGHSLNDHLLQGPDLTNNLVGVLLRFRNGQFAVTADIKRCSTKLKYPLTTEACSRYLWWPEGDTSDGSKSTE